MNFILSFIVWDKGFDEPSSIEWSNNICQADKSEIGKGINKCKVKNLVKVGWPTLNPPHNHWAPGKYNILLEDKRKETPFFREEVISFDINLIIRKYD